jgi:hypothetical protein
MTLVGSRAIDQMHDAIDRAVSSASEQLRFGTALEVFRELSEQTGKGVSKLLDVLELIGAGPRAAGVTDFLVPRHDFEHVARKFTLRIPQVDLKGQGVAARLRVDHPLQRRVRDETAVPVMFALDLDRGETGRQRAARHHVFGPDGMCRAVKIGEITGSEIDRAGAEAGCAAIETIEVDESLQRALQIARVVEAGGLDRSCRLKPRKHRSCREKTSCAAR